MNNSVINIINQIVVLVGFPAIIAGLIYTGRKLQILDDLKKKSDGIEDFSKCATGAIDNIQKVPRNVY
ncbi:hypothetical protein D4R87_00740 [bacterium]|nr:MAG: hypothetical protein D4R87_00740 [bacterium]